MISDILMIMNLYGSMDFNTAQNFSLLFVFQEVGYSPIHIVNCPKKIDRSNNNCYYNVGKDRVTNVDFGDG